MTTMNRRILVVGGGPAGASTAWWLAKAGFEVLIAERSTQRFAYGQGIDITGSAVNIVEKMGLMPKIKENTTGEGGFALLDDNAQIIASTGVNEDSTKTAATLTQEIEIMRGKLTEIFAEAANSYENVTYRYGCTVDSIQQNEKSVSVKFSDNGEIQEFLAVIGADGIRSKVRRLIFDEKINQSCYNPKGLFVGYYSIPGQTEDVPNARFQNVVGGRSILIRPIDRVSTRSSCACVYVGESERLKNALDGDFDAKKEALLELFADAPGLGDRARQGMRAAEDFYYEEIAQIKIPSWHAQRVALVGDAAYAPSPLTGQGTALAILGSYYIAGELAAHPEDVELAYSNYEKKIRKYVDGAQNIPLGGQAPKLLQPQSAWGISIFRTAFRFIAWTQVWKYLNLSDKKEWPLEEYSFKLDD